jgi:hypothetical protein
MTLPLGTGDGARVPIRTERTDHQIQSDIAALLFDIRTELQHIRHELSERSASVSSVEIDSNGKAGETKIKVKEYADSDPPVAEAIANYATAMREAADGYLRGWSDTLEMVQRERGEP